MTTGAAIERDFLHRAMDARAENLKQPQLVYNPSRDCDSLLEHLQAIYRLTRGNDDVRRHLVEALRIIVALVESNRREGEHEQHIAGAADQLVTDLRRAEHHPQPPALWTAKKIAKQLRDPLADLCNPVIKGRRQAKALRAVHDVLDQAPAQLALSVTVRHELGVKKYTRLLELAAEREGRAA